MSAPTSLINSHYSSLSTNTSTMATTTANQYRTGTSGATTTTTKAATKSDTDRIDLIECKFNELAKKILDELKQSNHSREFFQALDLILNEPQQQQIDKQSARLKLFISSATAAPDRSHATSRRRQQANDRIKEQQDDQHSELKRKYDMLMEKQRQQQEQLDSHQQILFDNQYKSLPSEITGGRGAAFQRKTTTTEKTGATKPQQATQVAAEQQASENQQGARLKNASADKLNVILGGLSNQQQRQSQQQQPQRSAIPTSTILSGISQQNPLIKSATTGSFTSCEGATSNHLIRQSSLRLKSSNQNSSSKNENNQRQPAKKDNDNQLDSKQQAKATLTPSEKLKQRRPTKASIVDSSNQQRLLNRSATQDDDSDDEKDDDNDEDDDDYEYENLIARRAYLNQRFIQPFQHQQQQQQPHQQPQKQRQLAKNGQVVKSKTFSDAKNHLSVSVEQNRQQVASKTGESATSASTANRLSPVGAAIQQHNQHQRFQSSGSQIARSNTTTVATGGAALVGVTGQRLKQANQALVTSCKLKTQKQPQSINIIEDNSDDNDDDFDDDDEDDADQPRSINGLMSSNSGNMISGQLYKPHMNYSTSLLGNHRLSDDDEIIIIPTAQSPSSLIMSASQSPVNPQQSQQQQLADEPISGNLDEFNERFSISRTKSFWEKLANSKKPSTVNVSGGGGGDGQQQHTSLNSGDANNNNNSSKMIHNQHSTVKSAFDRLDSTGGSGNSHYSGCSSNSSTSGDEQQNVFANRLTKVGGGQPLVNRGQQRGPNNKPVAMNPTINQLVHQDQLNRSDRFRQTR